MVELAIERIPPDLTRKRDEMLALRDEVSVAQASIAKLASKRAYHFGKLPLEIATAIFGLVLADDHAQVIILAQVCRNWRVVILDTPTFWGTLVLGTRRPKRKLEVWLKRSRNRIRELAVLDGVIDDLHSLEGLDAVRTGALRSLRQENYTPDSLLLHRSFPFLDIIASLDQLTLHAHTIQQFLPTMILAKYLNWRVLELTKIITAFEYDLAERLKQLEILSLKNCLFVSYWGGFLKLLLVNSGIAQLKFVTLNPVYIRDPDEDETEEEIPAIIPMPSLTNIHIEDTQQLANVLLPRLDARSLISLHIFSHRERLDACLSWLTVGSAAKLTTLAIQRSPVAVHPLIAVLKSAPHLETFQLTHICDVAPAILKALATPLEPSPPASSQGTVPTSSNDTSGERAPMSRVVCPSLRDLDVSHCPDVVASPIISLVRLRHPDTHKFAASADDSNEDTRVAPLPVQPLQSLVIDGCSKVDADVLPWLRAAVPFVSCIYLARNKANWRR